MSERKLEAQLIKKCREGDTTAFSKLITIYRKRLYTYLLRITRDRMMAEDSLQDTLIKAWKGLNNYNEQQKFSSWLFTVAHNVSIDAIRMRKVRRGTVSLSDDMEIASDLNPHTSLVITERRITLQKEVENLPEDQRRVFLLRQHGDLSFKEISEIMNQPLNTVLSHMHYAVKKLKRCLNEEE